MKNYNFEQLKQKVYRAIDNFLTYDSDLLIQDVHERTITFRLGTYLQNEFNDYNVDCEYNRNIESDTKQKFIYFLKEDCKRIGIDFKEKQLELINGEKYLRKNVFPDIIIHRRWNNEKNFLAIELKKTSNNQSRDYDDLKLKRYTKEISEYGLGYKWGLFIELETGNKLSIKQVLKWYSHSTIYKEEERWRQL